MSEVDRCYQVADQSVLLCCPDATAAGWVDRYIDGFWPVAPGGPASVGAVTVTAVLDPGERRRLTGRARGRGEPCVGFLGARSWRCDDGSRIVAGGDDPPVAFVRDRASPELRVVGDDSEALGIACVRILRAMVGARLEATGWAQVHASAVAGPAGAVLAFGAKGAGKTAVALSLATRCGWRVLANDRLWLRADAGGAAAVAWPSSLNLGLGLLRAIGWAERLRAAGAAGRPPGYHEQPEVSRALAAGATGTIRNPAGRELKCQLFPAELTSLFGVGLCSGAPVRALLFPAVELTGADSALDRLDEAPVGPADLLPAPDGPDHFPDFLDLHATTLAARRAGGAATLARLAASTPAYRIRLGRNLDRAAALLAATAEAPS